MPRPWRPRGEGDGGHGMRRLLSFNEFCLILKEYIVKCVRL